MRNDDAAEFKACISDLCVAFNRPYSDDITRVFWEALKWAHIADVKRMALKHRETAKKFPTPHDLKPERVAVTPAPKAPEPFMSTWAIAANKILWSVAYQGDRGFRAIGPKLLPEALRVKADYVRMATEAEQRGEPWATEDFNRMCREGFQALLARADAA